MEQILAILDSLPQPAFVGDKMRLRGAEDLLEKNALSEGEYMLLVRLGLLTMGRQEEN